MPSQELLVQSGKIRQVLAISEVWKAARTDNAIDLFLRLELHLWKEHHRKDECADCGHDLRATHAHLAFWRVMSRSEISYGVCPTSEERRRREGESLRVHWAEVTL